MKRTEKEVITMTKITFTNALAALDYAVNLERYGFISVPAPGMVREDRFCRKGNEVYIFVVCR